ncbi:type II secretion system F family protein [Luteimonas abyssi]|uniref:type II secretion system F family protein n=1 Tax=Luteimonas abyssi TaxID=1247514 RepID=UPI000737C25A|nr:type II secretion system F family protein [Luteimonas abyssi]
MTGVLALLAVSALVLAGAMELWWQSTAQARQRAALAHTERNLGTTATAGIATRQAAGAAGRTGSHRAQPAPVLYLRDLLHRAALSEGGFILALSPGMALAVVAAMRLGTAWAALPMLIVYLLGLGFWLHRRIDALRQKLLRQMPDVLDDMVRMAGIGNSLPMAFQAATQHAPPPLRALLDATLSQVRSGQDLDRALQAAARPYRIPVFDVLAIVLGTAIRVGGRADQVLQRMSDFIRDQEQAQRDLRATTSETRASAWVLGLLPPVCALAMAMLSPDFFMPMIETSTGHRLLLAALVFEGIGAVFLYRLARSL